jgi:hypothetical protein
MTIIAVDIFYTPGSALFACFSLPFDLQVATGDYIAGLESLDQNFLGNDPTEGLCSYLRDISPEDDHNTWFIKAEKILTLWMNGKPVKIVRTSVRYAEGGDDHRGIIEKNTVADIESAWQIVRHLALQFRDNVWVEGSDDKDPLKGKWSVPNAGCELVLNPLYSAMKFLTQATQTDAAQSPVPKTPIEKLHLSTRAENPLRDANIEYVEDLIKMNFHQLMKLRHFGKGSFHEVRKKLQDRGFKLDAGWKMPGSSNRGWVPDIP